MCLRILSFPFIDSIRSTLILADQGNRYPGLYYSRICLGVNGKACPFRRSFGHSTLRPFTFPPPLPTPSQFCPYAERVQPMSVSSLLFPFQMPRQASTIISSSHAKYPSSSLLYHMRHAGHSRPVPVHPPLFMCEYLQSTLEAIPNLFQGGPTGLTSLPSGLLALTLTLHAPDAASNHPMAAQAVSRLQIPVPQVRQANAATQSSANGIFTLPNPFQLQQAD